MKSSSEDRWRLRGAFRESLVIVSSILIAFGVDAWWDARADEVQYRAFLEALAEDIEGTRAELERVRIMHEQIAETAARLMSSSSTGGPIASCEAVADPYSFLLAHPSIDPPMGTVETILSSGRADLVRDRELLRELTRWSSLVEDLQREEEEANAHLTAEVFPLLRDALDLKSVIRSVPYVWEDVGEGPVPCELVASRTFQSVIYRYWNYHQVSLREGIPALKSSLEAVSGMLEAALAR